MGSTATRKPALTFAALFLTCGSVTCGSVTCGSAFARDFVVTANGQRYRLSIADTCRDFSCVYVHVPRSRMIDAAQARSTTRMTGAPGPDPVQTGRSVTINDEVPLPPRRPASLATDGHKPPSPKADVATAAKDATAPDLGAGAALSGANVSVRDQSEPKPPEVSKVETSPVSPEPGAGGAALSTPPSQTTDSHEQESPLGYWVPEFGIGEIHIVACGSDFCGYAHNTAKHSDDSQVLIKMTPAGDRKWIGRIHDRDDGTDRTSTILQDDPDILRVGGCALKGVMCDGQVWRRV